MTLVIDEETLRKVWGSVGEFWFSRLDYTVHSMLELNSDDDVELINNGFVPFLNITNEEIIRSYISSLDNKKLQAKFDGFYSEECVERFWKYFNVYPEVSGGYLEYEDKYVKERLESWCKDNSIDYQFAL